MVVDRDTVTRLSQQDLTVEIEDGETLVFIRSAAGEQRRVQNLISVGFAGSQRYYVFQDMEDPSRRLILVESLDSDRLLAFDFVEGYAAFAPGKGLFADAKPFGERADSFNYRVFDLTVGSVIFEIEQSYVRSPAGVSDYPVFHFVKPHITIETHERAGVYIEIIVSQGNYDILRHTYVAASGQFSTRSIGESAHSDLSRAVISTERTESGWRYSIDSDSVIVPYTVISPNQSGVPVGLCGNSSVAVVLGEKDHTLMIYRGPNRPALQYAFVEFFPYNDPIVGFFASYWTQGEIAFVVDTEEFNYDVIVTVTSGEAEVFLRSSDYDRFVR